MSGAKPSVRTVTARIDEECRRQGVSAVLLGKVMGVPYKRALNTRGAHTQRLMVSDVVAAARALDVPLESLLAEVNE